MKYLTTAVLLFLLSATFNQAAAQNKAWVEVSGGADFFRVSMPNQPKEEFQTKRYGDLNVTGRSHEADVDGASYAVWAFVNANHKSNDDPDTYLDQCADLIWETLLRPARDKLPNDGSVRAAMTYVKELLPNPLVGREYTLTIGELTGTAQFYIADTRVYILLAMHSPGGVWEEQKFFASFSLLPGLPLANRLYGDPVTGTNQSIQSEAASDPEQVFSGKETTQKVRILEKDEPTYTESARKYGVQGTIVMRAVFSSDGEVKRISVTRKLPHGLTQAAVNAARAIRFTPAMKDGQVVSMWMELQYNFHLY
ncbi:MAG TPA: energy transducer TonB [Pyrinomonadaceae bacterium]